MSRQRYGSIAEMDQMPYESIDESDKKEKKRFCCGRVGRCGCIVIHVLVIFLILSAIFWPVLFFVIAPKFAQSSVNHSSLTLIDCRMQNATNNTLRLVTELELNNAGMIAASISSFEVAVYDEDTDVEFGRMVMPSFDVVANSGTRISVDTIFTVTNKPLFTQESIAILQGQGGQWKLKGSPELSVKLFGHEFKYNVDMNKIMSLPQTLLEQVTARDITVQKGTATELIASSTTTFVSSSVLQMRNLGSMSFDLFLLPSNNRLGTVVIDNFNVVRGFNSLTSTTILQKDANDPVSVATVSQFLSQYAMGKAQQAVIRGPYQSNSPFLSTLVTQQVTISGSSEPNLIESGYISVQGLIGMKVNGKTLHYAGVVQRNPNAIPIVQQHAAADIDLLEPMSYTFKHMLVTTEVCKLSNKFAHQETGAGMWGPSDPTNSTTWTGAMSSSSSNTIASPQPGQSTGSACTFAGVKFSDWDCCFSFLTNAAACRAKARKELYIATSFRGTISILLGQFAVTLTYYQPFFPTLYDEVLTTGEVLDLDVSCSNFIDHNW